MAAQDYKSMTINVQVIIIFSDISYYYKVVKNVQISSYSFLAIASTPNDTSDIS